MLVQKARENSLRKNIDSPFAILAKENDVMWSGGMPDDCTCSTYDFGSVGARLDEILNILLFLIQPR